MSGTHPATAAEPATGSPGNNRPLPAPLPTRPSATDVQARPSKPPADPETLARIKAALERDVTANDDAAARQVCGLPEKTHLAPPFC